MEETFKDNNEIQPFKDRVTEKNKAFLDEYLSNGFNKILAYQTVYHDVTYTTAKRESTKLLQKPTVAKLLKEKQSEMAEKQIIKREEVILKLKQLIERCVGDDDRPNLLKAIDQVNKMCGYFKDTNPGINLTTTGNIQLTIPGVTSEEIQDSNPEVD